MKHREEASGPLFLEKSVSLSLERIDSSSVPVWSLTTFVPLAYFDPNSESRDERAAREKLEQANGENGVANGHNQTPA
jgi:hypothetical protein